MFRIIFDTSGTHVVRYSQNMELILDEENKKTFYSEAKTEQKYAIWCSFCYLYGYKIRLNSDACNRNQ